MKWLFAFGWIPTPVFYPQRLFAGGFSPLMFILIRVEYRNDAGLHQHELEHIEQAWRIGMAPHAILYLLSRRYRLWAEVRAYRRQVACYGPGASVEFAVRALVEDYRLGIGAEEARALLTGKAAA